MRKFKVPNAIAKPQHDGGKKIPQQSPSHIPSQNKPATSQQFICIFNKKGPKKKKIFIDGFLEIHGDKLILKDATTKLQVSSSRPTSKVLSDIQTGSTVDIGHFEVEVMESVHGEGSTVSAASTIESKQVFTRPFLKPPPLMKQTSSSEAKIVITTSGNNLARPVFKSLLVNASSSDRKTISLQKRRSPPPLLKPIDVTTDNMAISSSGKSKMARICPTEIEDPLAPTPDPGMKSLLRVLQPHQMEAVQFLWKQAISAYERRDGCTGGCILADSMGLGKTLSTIAFIYTCIHHRLASKVVVVVPSSLVENWRNEFSKWLRHFLSPHVNTADRKILIAATGENKTNKYSKKTPKRKKGCSTDGKSEEEYPVEKELGGVEAAVVEFIKFKAPVLIISYEGFRKHSSLLNEGGKVSMIICDEGHRLKCAQGSKTFSSLKENPAFFKLLLTGTPVQNDLLELYAMVNFVKPGWLGSLGEFRREYSDAIASGRDLLCSEDEKGYGKVKANELRRLLQSVILRRTAEVLVKSLPPRKELVVFCRLSPHQQCLYESLLESSGYGSLSNKLLDGDSLVDHELEVDNEAAGRKDALASIHALRMVCNHPQLLEKQTKGTEDVNVDKSSKLMLLQSLLSVIIGIPTCSSSIERMVIVSNFTSTLDIIGEMALSNGWKSLRIDGSTPPDQRQGLVDRFNRRSETDDAYLFLLSSHAGGVGLNLVGASRLVLYDSDWNPAIDQQTMGRIWRQGQKKPVFIYRLLCTGTLEEKMYQRQIAKGELSSAVDVNSNLDFNSDEVGGEVDVRHFEREDIRDLFCYRSEVRFCDTFDCMRGRWTASDTEGALEMDPALRRALDTAGKSTCRCEVSFIRLE